MDCKTWHDDLPTVGVGEVALAEDDSVEGHAELDVDRHAALGALHVHFRDGRHVGHGHVGAVRLLLTAGHLRK